MYSPPNAEANKSQVAAEGGKSEALLEKFGKNCKLAHRILQRSTFGICPLFSRPERKLRVALRIASLSAAAAPHAAVGGWLLLRLALSTQLWAILPSLLSPQHLLCLFSLQGRAAI